MILSQTGTDAFKMFALVSFLFHTYLVSDAIHKVIALPNTYFMKVNLIAQISLLCFNVFISYIIITK